MLFQGSFKKLKQIYVQSLKSQSLAILNPKLPNSFINLTKKRSLTFFNLIQRVFFNDVQNLRISFKKIKKYSKVQQNKLKGLEMVLGKIQIKRLKFAFKLLKEKKIDKVKKISLIRFVQILNRLKKRSLNDSLTKLFCFVVSLNKQQRQSEQQAIRQNEKIKKQTQKAFAQIREIQQKISALKTIKSQKQINQVLAEKLEDEEKQQEINEKEKQQKLRLAESLKQKLTILTQSYEYSIQQQVETRSQPSQIIQNQVGSSKLPILHSLYMRILRLSNDQIQTPQFLQLLFLTYQAQNQAQTCEQIKKWLLFDKNLKLKSQIDFIQKNFRVNKNSEACLALEEENNIINKFIRSYIKQRYIWEEIKEYIEAAIQ